MSRIKKNSKDLKTIQKMVLLNENDLMKMNVVSNSFGNESAGVIFRRLLNNEYNSIIKQSL